MHPATSPALLALSPSHGPVMPAVPAAVDAVRPTGRRRPPATLSLVVTLLLLGAAIPRSEPAGSPETDPGSATATSDAVDADASAAGATLDDLTLHHRQDPARTVVEDADGAWVATFTSGARTVTLAGPERRFTEEAASHDVVSRTWVRVLDEPFDGDIDPRWLDAARTDTAPDVLEVAMGFLPGAPEVRDDAGVLMSGEAAYGPLQADGTRPVGADWHDYQQVTATYGDDVKTPDPAEAGALDCSGYIRIVWGVHHDVPMTSRADGGASLPRISRVQADQGPGIASVAGDEGDGTRITDLGSLQPGDLVFFAASDRVEGIDHVGMYLGPDEAGRHRFISSRSSNNGPTMGDHRGPSLLDGDGLYARTFVATRRL